MTMRTESLFKSLYGCLVLALLVMASFAQLAYSASTPAAESARLLGEIEPRLRSLYEKNEFHTRSYTATWLPDGSGYLKQETPDGAPEIVSYDAVNGKRTVVIPSEKLVLPGCSRPMKLLWFQRSPSESADPSMPHRSLSDCGRRCVRCRSNRCWRSQDRRSRTTL